MGYYLMHRGWMDNPAFNKATHREPFCQRAAWAWLIENAQFEPAQVKVGGKVVELQRGQLAHSLRFLGEAWGWQHDRVRRFVAVLSQLSMIATDTATGRLIISICNYDKYQVPPEKTATPAASAVRQNRDRTATNLKKVINNSTPPGSNEPSGVELVASPLRGSRLPQDLDEIPPDWLEAALTARQKVELPEISLALDWEKFKNHWASQAGQRGVKKDWKKTWINWALNATPPWGRNGAGAPAANLFEGAWRVANEADEREWQGQSGNNGAGRGPAYPLLDRQ